MLLRSLNQKEAAKQAKAMELSKYKDADPKVVEEKGMPTFQGLNVL